MVTMVDGDAFLVLLSAPEIDSCSLPPRVYLSSSLPLRSITAHQRHDELDQEVVRLDYHNTLRPKRPTKFKKNRCSIKIGRMRGFSPGSY